MLTCLSPNEGQPGGVLTDDRVTGGPQTRDGGVDVAGFHSTTALSTRPSTPSWSSWPSRYACRSLPAARGTQPDPALRRGDHLHARLGLAPASRCAISCHAPSSERVRSRRCSRQHGRSQAGEDLGLTASHATPSSSIARGPAHHSDDAANTSRRRGAAGRATAPGRAARKRPGCHRPRGRLGRNRLQTLASCGILAYSRQPEIGAQEKIPGQSLRKDRRPRRPPALPASPRARPEPLTSESNGRPEKLAACYRSPDVSVHLENFGAGDLVGAPVPSVRRRPAAGLDDHGSGHILGRGPG